VDFKVKWGANRKQMRYHDKHIAKLKAFWDREKELGPSQKDLDYNPGYTPKQKDAMESEAYDIRLKMEERNKMLDNYRTKRYEDKTDKEETLWSI
jgi:hypothetical protein